MFIPSDDCSIGWYISRETNIQLQTTRDIKDECMKLTHSTPQFIGSQRPYIACQIEVPLRGITGPSRGRN